MIGFTQVLVEVFKLGLGVLRIGLECSTFGVVPDNVFNRVCTLGPMFLIGEPKASFGLGGSTFLGVLDT